MGIGDFFKKRFGKQHCAFCGNEVGMMKRDKIKNDEFICHDCRRGCSRYIQVYRYTKDELLDHMAYMKWQARLVDSLKDLKGYAIPSFGMRGIIFYKEAGMFRVYDRDKDDKYAQEMFRFDQVAGYEPYLIETEPSEPGKEKEFNEGGVKITLVGSRDDLSQMPRGSQAHPYITEQITVSLSKDNMKYVDNIIQFFDSIFGVGDRSKGLFSFGPTKQQKREGEALKAMGGLFKEAVKAAKSGEVSEEAMAKAQDALNKVDDAATTGLAQYSRLADEAEA